MSLPKILFVSKSRNTTNHETDFRKKRNAVHRDPHSGFGVLSSGHNGPRDGKPTRSDIHDLEEQKKNDTTTTRGR